MATIECNADLDHPCDADDGEPCPRCLETERYWKAVYEREKPYHIEPEQYREQMIDAGHGHLLGPEER